MGDLFAAELRSVSSAAAGSEAFVVRGSTITMNGSLLLQVWNVMWIWRKLLHLGDPRGLKTFSMVALSHDEISTRPS